MRQLQAQILIQLSSNFTNILKIQKRTEIWDKLYISISLYYITFINKN